MAATETGDPNLDLFFSEVEAIKADLVELERLHRRLRDYADAALALHDASALRALRAQTDADAALALSKAKLVRRRLESLDRSSAAAPGSSADRARAAVVAALRTKLRESTEDYAALRRQASAEHREAVARRYFAVTGEVADEATVEALMMEGEAERFLRRVIEEDGRGWVEDLVAEIRERLGAAEELERSLKELEQVFVDMGALVEAQGEQIDDIEANVGQAHSFVRHGAEELADARRRQKSGRKWAWIAAAVVVLILLAVILTIVLTITANKKKNKLLTSAALISSFSL